MTRPEALTQVECEIVARYVTKGNARRITVVRDAHGYAYAEAHGMRIVASGWRKTLPKIMECVAETIIGAHDVDGITFRQTI